jgi:hypothetical protein
MGDEIAARSSISLAKTSLALGIVSISLVFGIGICALVGVQQGWIRAAGTPLFVCGASSAFLGFLAAILGIAGLLGKGSRLLAGIGLLLGGGGVCLFFLVLQGVGAG